MFLTDAAGGLLSAPVNDTGDFEPAMAAVLW